MRTILLLIVALAASLGGSAWGNDNEILLRTPDLMQLSEGIQAWEKGDRKDARRHFERAAEYGNNDARFSLGVMYFQGEGVERDLPRAHAWLSLAATVGSDQRVAARDQVWELMDDSQRKRARKVSQELRDKYGNLAAMRKRDEWGRKNKREFTGSRVGASASALRIDVPHRRRFDQTCVGPRIFPGAGTIRQRGA